MTIRTIVVKSEGLTLAQVIWREFRRQPTGYLEAVMDANPGLADVVHAIPVGQSIKLPTAPLATSKVQEEVVRLWD